MVGEYNADNYDSDDKLLFEIHFRYISHIEEKCKNKSDSTNKIYKFSF